MSSFLLITLIFKNVSDICVQINFLLLKSTITQACQPSFCQCWKTMGSSIGSNLSHSSIAQSRGNSHFLQAARSHRGQGRYSQCPLSVSHIDKVTSPLVQGEWENRDRIDIVIKPLYLKGNRRKGVRRTFLTFFSKPHFAGEVQMQRRQAESWLCLARAQSDECYRRQVWGGGWREGYWACLQGSNSSKGLKNGNWIRRKASPLRQ